MASGHVYKRFENNLVQKVKTGVRAVLYGLAVFFGAAGRFLTRRYTIVLVPHSEKKVYNFHVNFLSVFCFCLVLAGMAGTFIWYGVSWNGTQGALAARDSRLKDTQANLDQLRDEIALLLRQTRGFQTALSATLSSLGVTMPDNGGTNQAAGGDLSAFLDLRENSGGALPEVDSIRGLTDYFAAAMDPVQEISFLFASQSALLTEIPNIWPIRGGIGHVSMSFGQNPNPFSGQTYIHKGIDLSTYRSGDPVLATADGQVVQVDYDVAGGFGNYVIIKHKHGFYTRYAHLNNFRSGLTRGQRVQQGDVIGYIGDTGLSTGPHLHYEVHIGSDVVDPAKYLNLRAGQARVGR
ncbi:MAG: M23 family metallopeptidase [Spirochaetaceae bacterium]|nr:M23 family metallopeptidase [Spirochaetaceae bacterium]